MKTSFIALANKRGVACASDTDMTLYAISKQEPVALAVNPYSPIPWDAIINAYLRKGDVQIHETLADYAHDFASHLATVETMPVWKKMTEEDRNIIFLGYGKDYVFPAAVDIMVNYDEESQRLVCDFDTERCINHLNETDFLMLSHFDNMQAVLYGITDAARQKMMDKHTAIYDKLVERVMKAVKGSEFEAAVKAYLDNRELEEFFSRDMCKTSDNMMNEVNEALDSFNIEDLVKAAEDFVDASVQIDHLKGGGKGELRQTKELAVITRTEGVVWIKHCIYGN